MQTNPVTPETALHQATGIGWEANEADRNQLLSPAIAYDENTLYALAIAVERANMAARLNQAGKKKSERKALYPLSFKHADSGTENHTLRLTMDASAVTPFVEALENNTALRQSMTQIHAYLTYPERVPATFSEAVLRRENRSAGKIL